MSEVSHVLCVNLTCSAFRGDGAKLDTKGVPGVLEVLQSVAVTADSSVLLTTTVGQATSQTEPEVGRQVTLRALVGN